MPTQNRDKESLYPAGKLSNWFLVTSGLLAASMVAMVWLDHDRPWKKTQADFYRRQARLLEIERAVKDARTFSDWEGGDEGSKHRAEKKDLDAKIAAAKRILEEPAKAKEIQDLRADLEEQKARVDEADRRIKAIKGAYEEQRFALEMARKAVADGHGDAEKVRSLEDVIRRFGSDQYAWEAKRRTPEVRQAALDRQLKDVHKDLRELEEKRDALVKAVTDVETQRAAAEAKTEKNVWRNVPVIDFVSPSISIDKSVCPNILDEFNFAQSPKVDMCMTCHRGIAVPSMGEVPVRDLLADHLRMVVGEKAWKKIEGLVWIEREEKDLDGRKVTLRDWQGRWHEGEFKEWVLGRSASIWDLLPEREKGSLEKALGKDGLAPFLASLSKTDVLSPFRVKSVEWAHPHLDLIAGSASKHPMSTTGCTVCHAGRGWSTDFVRAMHAPRSAEQREEWERERGWAEPEQWDWPMLPARYVEGQCIKCHMPGVQFRPRSERLGAMQVEDPLLRVEAPKPLDGPVSEIDGQWHPERLERGVNAFRDWGCVGCHMVKKIGPAPGWTPPAEGGSADFATPLPGTLAWADEGPRKVGPDVKHLADKTTEAFVVRWVMNPTSFRIDTRMPAFYRYRAHDDAYRPQFDASGRPVDAPVPLMPADPYEAKRLAWQMDVEALALTKFLLWASKPLEGGYPAVPVGDPVKGQKTFYGAGCYGCHLGPGSKYDEKGTLVPDDGDRFKRRPELPPGPRLIGLGSKVKPEWLYEWLREPRHYWSATVMPNMRWRDEMSEDNKTIVRTADQIRADVVAFLMASKNAEFEAQEGADARWSADHDRLLDEMWLEYYAKDKAVFPAGATVAVAEQAAKDRKVADKLVDLGRKLVGQRGCFGCHNVGGYEHEQPIGKELSEEGSQDIHKFDFGILEKSEVPHTRWDWIERKLDQPRLYDRGRFKRWTDRLRMPRFNFTAVDREAVTTTVLGFVKEPILPPAMYAPGDRMRRIAAGRAVVQRYHCNQCHTVEGLRGILTAEQLERDHSEMWMLPPNLFGEGHRVHSNWLFGFLKNPSSVPDGSIRPSVIQRMPLFRMSDAEAAALVDYFLALAERPDRMWTDAKDRPLDDTSYPEPLVITVKDPQGKVPDRVFTVRNQVEEAKALFDTVNCVKCHLRKGTPGADPKEGASAPPFALAHDRLRNGWTFEMVHDPQGQIQNTKMTAFWGPKSKPKRRAGDTKRIDFPEFSLWKRGVPGATPDDVAEAQMEAVVRYLRWHFKDAAPPPTSPPPEPGGTQGK